MGGGKNGNNYLEETEKHLFDLIAQGSETAFKQLFGLWSKFFTVVIKKIIKNNAAAEDILQEVFLRIWLKRDMLESVEQPRAWALQIVYHISFNWLRHEKVCSKADQYLSQQKEEASNEVEESVFLSEISELIHRAIAQLPAQMRKIYCLNRENGLRIAEISQRLQLSAQTVKNTLSKATRNIRIFLSENGDMNVND